ncbi:MAG: glycosyl hydrolase family 18 protein [Eubacteriales bacterium]
MASSAAQTGSNQASAASAVKSTATSLPPFKLSVWVAYWDWENGLKDLNALTEMPDSVQAFGASFDQFSRLILPEGMAQMAENIKPLQTAHPEMQVFLTIVNDSMDADGKWTDKDSNLTDRLMESAESRSNHISEILALLDKGSYSGVEIDYEKISDQSWGGFADFCSKLQTALQEKGKKLRVVLEPGCPFEMAHLPEGPEYILMAYNLYGGGTEPGPKADDAFIRKLAVKLKALPGSKSIAFATGGYDWDADGSVQELNETEAYSLSQKGQDIQRDSQSGGLHFTYQKDGSTHTVWYADGQTLKGWFNLSRSLGIGDVSVWRMGGDSPETLQMLGQLKESK